ncbi:di-heme-cytochrome C peroxidase [Bradyrhizobium sp. USDA 10063]
MKVGLRVPLLAIAALLFLSSIAVTQDNTVRQNPVHLPQGWSTDTLNRWHFISQGTPLIPYEWFLALEHEQPGHTTPIRSPENLQRLGFLAEPARPGDNEDGLPVGLYKLPVNFDDSKYVCWKGNWLGLGCAGCHTGQVNYRGQQIRIEGGPAHIDIDGFVEQIKRSLAKVLLDPRATASFVGRVRAPAADVRSGLACFANVFKLQKVFSEAVREGKDDTAAGFGRLDAHGKGLNQLLAAPLGEVKNYAPLVAPVRFPALWDTPYFNWVLYNGSIRQPLARNVIEALGVQAPIQHNTMLGDRVVHAIQMDNVIWGQRMLMDLRSPPWPESILGMLDQKKVARGGQLYANACADCHDARPTRTRSEGSACEEIRIPLFDLDTIGTDREQATTFNKRRISLEKIHGPPDIANYKAAETVTKHIDEQWISQSPANAALAEEINCGRPNSFRAPLAYRARPLNGIWAMAPYLHNGSVPSLYDLLLPPDQRPRKLYVGNWEFNPEIVGYDMKNQFPDALPIDTAARGNSNAGHEYGTDLSEEDRKALIEYLKTL